VLHKANELKIEIWPLDDKLGPHDLHLWKKGFAGDFVVKKPLVLGHEPSAEVIAVGTKVRDLKAGDRVAVEPIISCGRCEYCRMGRYNLCPISFVQSRGLPPMDGCLQQYFTHPDNCLFKIPDNMSWDEGSMVEPFAVVVHACRRVHLEVGHRVLVCGAGMYPFKVCECIQFWIIIANYDNCIICIAFGATKVCITDIDQSRLNLAKKMGADQTFLIDTKTFNDIEFVKTLNTQFGRIDTCIECSGVESSVSTAIHATRIGGRICTLGLGPAKIRVPMSAATLREIDIIGSCRIKDDYPLAIELISSGKVDLKPLVTHRL
ncbi:unnamed protein product, partial [Oppiella nova]